MGSRVYDLLSELSSPSILRTQTETKAMMDELLGLLESGEDTGKFRSSVLDTYYPEFIKEAIRTCRKKCKDITDSLYYPVLELLFRRYRVDPDNTDDTGITPIEYASSLDCKPYISYLQRNGSASPKPKKTPKPKKPTKTKTKTKTKKKTKTKTKTKM